MKTTSGIVCGALLALSASWPVGAGEIVDTFSPGDTLTATMMNNIKAAVNDNNTAVRFYGDGSAGDLTLASGASVNWLLTAQSNLNFQNVTIESGANLYVPAGTTIRCTGDFVNNGTINVWTGSGGGKTGYTDVDFVAESWIRSQDTMPGRGDTPRAATSGQMGTENSLFAGFPGDRIVPTVAAGSFMSFRWGGGAGSGGWGGVGGSGGGLLKVLCKGDVRNETGGTISANGYGSAANPGTGGGSGGIVVLASQQRVVNEGSIEAKGGPGGVSNSVSGAGGGGGGGIVILVAPDVTNNGTVDVSAGAAGVESTQPVKGTNPRYGGGAGGSSGGRGGRGSSLNASGISASAEDGFDGYVLEIQANPATMM